MARFINNNIPFVNTGFRADSLDEMSRLPLLLAARDEANINAANEAILKYDTIAVPEDERARAIHQQKRNELLSQVNSITDTINRNGSLDPSVVNQLREMKVNYNQMTSPNGLIGRLADARTTIDAQRIASRQDAAMKGHSDEGWNFDISRQEQEWRDRELGRLVEDPNYVPQRFIARLPGDKVTVESSLSSFDLGSITTSSANSGVEAIPGADGSVTFNYRAGSEASSNNVYALNQFSNYMSNQIQDVDSPLMRSYIYNNPNKSIDEIRQMVIDETLARVNASVRSNYAESSSNDVKFTPGIGGPQSPNDESNASEANIPGSDLTSTQYGLERTEDFKDIDQMVKIVSGEEERELERLEAQLDSMRLDGVDESDPEYQDLMTDIINRKSDVANMKFFLEEQMENMSDADYTNILNIVKKVYPKIMDYKINGRSLTGFLSDGRKGIKRLKEINEDLNIEIDEKGYGRAYQLLTPLDRNNQFSSLNINVENFKFSQNVPEETPSGSRWRTVEYSGKKGIQEYLSTNGVDLTSEEVDELLTLYNKERKSFSVINGVDSNVLKSIKSKNKDKSFNSNIIARGTNPETMKNIDDGLTSLGSGAIVGQLIQNDNNFIYESSGKSYIRDIKGKDKKMNPIKAVGMDPNAVISFDKIIQNPIGKPSVLMVNVEATVDGDKKIYSMGIEINPTPQGSVPDVNSALIDNIINNISGPAKDLLQAVKDNTMYKNRYVDIESVGKNGVSSNQLRQLQTTANNTYMGNKTYKEVSPLANPNTEKGNIVYHRNGFYSFNYQEKGSNDIKSVTIADYNMKELVGKQIDNRSLALGEGRVYSEDQIRNIRLNTEQGRLQASNFTRQMFETMGLILAEGIYVDPEIKSYIQSETDKLNDPAATHTIESQFNTVWGVYNRLKEIPLMHRNSTKGI